MSGKPDYQGKENQGLKDKGPLPEGTYVARQSKIQFYKDIDWLDRQKSHIWRGSWPGGTDSWGDSRVWLEPAEKTNLLGRKKFSVHGGKDLGSLGCIDLTSQMDDFTKWFTGNNKDVIIYVKY